jgi:hypothetical protein
MPTDRSPKIGALELQNRRSVLGIVAGGGIAALLPGCAMPVRGPAVPMDRTTQASVLGVPNERFFPFCGTQPFEIEVQAAEQRQSQTLGLAPDARMPAVQFLAVCP